MLLLSHKLNMTKKKHIVCMEITHGQNYLCHDPTFSVKVAANEAKCSVSTTASSIIANFLEEEGAATHRISSPDTFGTIKDLCYKRTEPWLPSVQQISTLDVFGS